MGPGTIRQYLVTAQEGQIITIQILGDSSGSTSFEVLMPGGGMMPDASGVVEWVSYLPMGGEYAINVQADQPSEFELNVQISAQIPTEPAAP